MHAYGEKYDDPPYSITSRLTLSTHNTSLHCVMQTWVSSNSDEYRHLFADARKRLYTSRELWNNINLCQTIMSRASSSSLFPRRPIELYVFINCSDHWHFLLFMFQHFTQPAVIEQLAYFLIAIGAIMFFLSFLGYCGAIRESQCLLTTVSN